jgi:hypothetical protein
MGTEARGGKRTMISFGALICGMKEHISMGVGEGVSSFSRLGRAGFILLSILSDRIENRPSPECFWGDVEKLDKVEG